MPACLRWRSCAIISTSAPAAANATLAPRRYCGNAWKTPASGRCCSSASPWSPDSVNPATASFAHDLPRLLQRQARRAGPLGLIVLLHIGLFYLLQSGLMRQAVQTLPQEV